MLAPLILFPENEAFLPENDCSDTFCYTRLFPLGVLELHKNREKRQQLCNFKKKVGTK